MQALSTAYRSPCPEDATFVPISVNPNLANKFNSHRPSGLPWHSSGIHWSDTLRFAPGDGSLPGSLDDGGVVKLRDTRE
jgi:hypothetical protein